MAVFEASEEYKKRMVGCFRRLKMFASEDYQEVDHLWLIFEFKNVCCLAYQVSYLKGPFIFWTNIL